MKKTTALPPAKATKPGTAPAEPSFPPLLVDAPAAAALCGVSEATWWRHHSGGLCPKPVKLGGRTLWRVQELREWVSAGCPDREIWEARQAAAHRGKTRA
jgi:predicted DNA-binding transcriptional regulator AlpA